MKVVHVLKRETLERIVALKDRLKINTGAGVVDYVVKNFLSNIEKLETMEKISGPRQKLVKENESLRQQLAELKKIMLEKRRIEAEFNKLCDKIEKTPPE
ncbi:hypothetical protein [Desulfospira joergensenii]|uniref:hypothetical protein n=1 Tax=Desulfospira joergensenii TaxID=53329 RepID=UPI0003B4A426|nr:hypothetical protein [Desulfospira joergensenii]